MNKNRYSSGFSATVAGAVLCVLGLVLYALGAVGGYYDDFSAVIAGTAVFGVALGFIPCILSKQIGNDSRWRLLQVAAAGLLMWALTQLLTDRVFSIAVLLGSDLEASNQEAYVRLYFSLGALGALLAAVIAQITACFLRIKGKEQ